MIATVTVISNRNKIGIIMIVIIAVIIIKITYAGVIIIKQ